MEELKKMLDAVSLQLVIAIIIGIVSIVITNSVYSGINTIDELIAAGMNPLSILSMFLSLVSLVAIGWAGYAWVKETKGTAVDGGKAGALVSAISGAITGYLSMIYVYPIMSKFMVAAGASQMASGFGFVSYIIGIVISAVIGFVLGAIGSVFAKR
jgi:hypothetical protein